MKGAFLLAAGLALATLTTVTVAAEDPIKVREELMEGIGDAAKVVGPMMQGKAPFDAAKAAAAFTTISKNAADFPNHFPEGRTRARPRRCPPSGRTRPISTPAPRNWRRMPPPPPRPPARRRGVQGRRWRRLLELQGLPRKISQAELIQAAAGP